MNSKSGRRLLVEVCIVVLGILIALGVDRLNEGRKDRITEASYLRALASDLEADTVALAAVVRSSRRTNEAANRIAGYLDEGSSRVEEAGALAWDINRAGWTTFFRSTDFAYRDLVSTGRLDLIQDAELRRLVVAFYSRVEAYEQYNDIWSAAPHERYNPAIERILSPSAWRIIKTSSGSESEDGLDVEDVLQQLRTSDAVRNVLVTIAVGGSQQAGAMEGLRAQAVELLNAIEASWE